MDIEPLQFERHLNSFYGIYLPIEITVSAHVGITVRSRNIHGAAGVPLRFYKPNPVKEIAKWVRETEPLVAPARDFDHINLFLPSGDKPPPLPPELTHEGTPPKKQYHYVFIDEYNRKQNLVFTPSLLFHKYEEAELGNRGVISFAPEESSLIRFNSPGNWIDAKSYWPAYHYDNTIDPDSYSHLAAIHHVESHMESIYPTDKSVLVAQTRKERNSDCYLFTKLFDMLTDGVRALPSGIVTFRQVPNMTFSAIQNSSGWVTDNTSGMAIVGDCLNDLLMNIIEIIDDYET